MEASPHLLMCPPDHYGIEYEINPWMSRSRRADRELAALQWHGLRNVLEQAGARISCLEPRPGVPDLVFTANAALIHEDLAILARFRHPERRREQAIQQQWFTEHGFRVYTLTSRSNFEGAGDALFCGDTLFAGYRIRSDIRAHQEIGALLGCRVVPLELVDPHFYHLDTCFCPLAPGVAIYYPEAFDAYGRRAVRELLAAPIPVCAADAHQFVCNAVVVGKQVITGTGGGETHRQLRDRGFTPCETSLTEFIKGGGSAKCLTLRLDGEEAAAWKSRLRVGAAPSGTGPAQTQAND
jgi:N-dimethylarginine dimethylaminohydrolase